MGIRSMRIFKFFLIGIVGLFVAMTALSLLFPSRMRVIRSVNMAVPREKAYAVVSDFRTWEQWNAFIRGTPLTGKSLSVPSAGKGAMLRSDQLVITEGASEPDY